MQEHRRCQRWKFNRKVSVKFDDDPDYTDCTVTDLNFKGIQVILKQQLMLDKFLKMNIMLSRDVCINAEVWIAWHKKSGDADSYGIYFNKISDTDKEKIYRLMRTDYPLEFERSWWQGTKIEEGGRGMQNEWSDDKRIFARFGVDYALKFIDKYTYKEGVAHTQDFSAKGLGLVTEQPLSPQSSLEMWLQLPDKGQPLYTRGEVVWSQMVGPNKYRSGIELEKADLMGMSRVFRTLQ